MNDLRKQYIDTKCIKCKNKNIELKESQCDIRVFQHDGYLYCKCSNYSSGNNEIRRKLI